MEQLVSPSETSTRSVVRAVQILKMLGRAPEGCTLTQIALGVALSKATVSRMLQTLVGEGLVDARGGSGPYVVGNEFIQIAMAARQSSRSVAIRRLCTLSDGVLIGLRDRTAETVALVMRQGELRTNIAVVLGTHELIAVPKVGAKLPLHLGGPGKLLMAFLGKSEFEVLVERSANVDSPMRSFVDSKACRADLRRIRNAKFATSLGEAVDGQASLAAPVLNAGEILAVVNLIIPTVRFDQAREAEILPHVQAAAAELTSRVRGHFDHQELEWE